MEMKKRVLLIDDEADLCNLICKVLAKEGFDVDCASSLAEAAEKLHRHPDIILLDNNLPDGSGLAYIQMHPLAFMSSFVVMITADPSGLTRRDAEIVGIQAFIEKPFSMKYVKDLLKSVA